MIQSGGEPDDMFVKFLENIMGDDLFKGANSDWGLRLTYTLEGYKDHIEVESLLMILVVLIVFRYINLKEFVKPDDFIEALNDKNLLNFPNENGYLNKRKFLNFFYQLIKHVENLNTVKEYYDFQIESGPILKEGQVKDVVGLDKRRRWTKEGETWNPAEEVTEELVQGTKYGKQKYGTRTDNHSLLEDTIRDEKRIGPFMKRLSAARTDQRIYRLIKQAVSNIKETNDPHVLIKHIKKMLEPKHFLHLKFILERILYEAYSGLYGSLETRSIINYDVIFNSIKKSRKEFFDSSESPELTELVKKTRDYMGQMVDKTFKDFHNTSFENFRRRILTYDKGLPRRGWSTTTLLNEYKEYLLLNEISQRIFRIKVEIIDICNKNIENLRKINKEMLIYRFYLRIKELLKEIKVLITLFYYIIFESGWEINNIEGRTFMNEFINFTFKVYEYGIWNYILIYSARFETNEYSDDLELEGSNKNIIMMMFAEIHVIKEGLYPSVKNPPLGYIPHLHDTHDNDIYDWGWKHNHISNSIRVLVQQFYKVFTMVKTTIINMEKLAKYKLYRENITVEEKFTDLMKRANEVGVDEDSLDKAVRRAPTSDVKDIIPTVVSLIMEKLEENIRDSFMDLNLFIVHEVPKFRWDLKDNIEKNEFDIMAKALQRDSDIFEREFIYDYNKVYNDMVNGIKQPVIMKEPEKHLWEGHIKKYGDGLQESEYSHLWVERDIYMKNDNDASEPSIKSGEELYDPVKLFKEFKYDGQQLDRLSKYYEPGKRPSGAGSTIISEEDFYDKLLDDYENKQILSYKSTPWGSHANLMSDMIRTRLEFNELSNLIKKPGGDKGDMHERLTELSKKLIDYDTKEKRLRKLGRININPRLSVIPDISSENSGMFLDKKNKYKRSPLGRELFIGRLMDMSAFELHEIVYDLYEKDIETNNRILGISSSDEFDEIMNTLDENGGEEEIEEYINMIKKFKYFTSDLLSSEVVDDYHNILSHYTNDIYDHIEKDALSEENKDKVYGLEKVEDINKLFKFYEKIPQKGGKKKKLTKKKKKKKKKKKD